MRTAAGSDFRRQTQQRIQHIVQCGGGYALAAIHPTADGADVAAGITGGRFGRYGDHNRPEFRIQYQICQKNNEKTPTEYLVCVG